MNSKLKCFITQLTKYLALSIFTSSSAVSSGGGGVAGSNSIHTSSSASWYGGEGGAGEDGAGDGCMLT